MSGCLPVEGRVPWWDSAQFIDRMMAVKRRSVTLLEARQARAQYRLAAIRALNTHLLAVLADARALARPGALGSTERSVQAFVDHYSAVIGFIREQTRCEAATNQAGVLLGDPSVMEIQRDLRSAVLGRLPAVGGGRDGLRAIGVSETAAGALALDVLRLRAAAGTGTGASAIARVVQSVARRTEGLLKRLTDPVDGYVKSKEDTVTRQAQGYARQIERREAELARMALNTEG